MFDPRLVPVLGTDHHLPAVPAARCQPEALRQRLCRQPPHWQAECLGDLHTPASTSATPGQGEAQSVPMPSAPAAAVPPAGAAVTRAAVLMPVLMHPEPTLLLTERSLHLPTHAGQVAFPGGKLAPGDADAVAAALREAEEEIGLPRQAAEVLGCLPDYRTSSAFVVTPVLALLPPGLRLQPNPSEVALLFEVPLTFLMNPAHHRRHALHWQGRLRHWYSMPYHDGRREHFIWGATAAMLRNLYRLLSA